MGKSDEKGRAYKPLKSEVVLERPAPWATLDESHSKASVFCSLFCGLGLYAAILAMISMIIIVHTGANVSGSFEARSITCSDDVTYDYYARELSEDLETDLCDCKLETSGRMLEDDDDDKTYRLMFELLAVHFYVPITACMMVGVISGLWLEGLRRLGTAIVIASMVCVGVMLVLMGGLLIKYEVTGAAVVIFLFVAVFTAYSIFRYKMILKAGKTLETAANGLGKNACIFAALVPVEVAYLCMIFFWMDGWSQSSSTKKISSTCEVEDDVQSDKMYVASLLLLWLGFYVDHIKVNVVAATIASWAFGQKTESTGCGGMAFKVLGWSLWNSQPTLAVTSLICTFVEKVKSTISSKCNWVNPFCCCIMLIGCLIASTIEAFGRFAVVLHAITAKPFIEASYHGYHLLVEGGNLEEAISSDFFISISLSLFSYVLSFLMGMSMWAWIDDLEKLDSMEFTGNWQYFFWFFFICFLILNCYPYLCVFLVILLGNWQLLADLTDGKVSAMLLGMLTSAVCHIIFDFFAAIVLDAVDTMIMCYAIDKSNGMVVADYSSKDPTVAAMYLIIDAKLTESNDDQVPEATPAAIPTAVAVASPLV